ncbi:MAG: MerR family transcriptional regulator [Lachnospiraceae bacterium]|nr:MerR family transcriptional regulator [Lachnospiraceae bacterium]
MYTMKEVSDLTGLSEHTIRYYDREGLLPLLTRTKSGIRRFSQDDLEWMKLICCLKNSGMPLEKIKTFMVLCLDGEKTAEARKELLESHRRYILEQIDHLNSCLGTINYKIDNYKTVGIFHLDRQTGA